MSSQNDLNASILPDLVASCNCGHSTPSKTSVQACQDYEYLSDLSENDKPWDGHKLYAEKTGQLLIQSEEAQHKKYANRIFNCANALTFMAYSDNDGVITHKLKSARFCRFSHCQICKWRRTLLWKARFYQSIPMIVKEFSAVRFIFLTLTVKNCQIQNLRAQLKEMSNAWKRLSLTNAFKNVLGFIRTTEVTRSKDGLAHPHYHCLLMVKSTYFHGNYYLTKDDWAEYWKNAMRLDYSPIVDIRTVRAKYKSTEMDLQTYLSDVVSEVMKYAIKPSQLIEEKEWMFEFITQIHKMRLIATGGAFKDLLKPEETNDDLLLKETSNKEELEEICSKMFGWSTIENKYRRRINNDSVKLY